MTTPTALLAALFMSTVFADPGPYPGSDGVKEGVRNTADITGTSQEATVTLSLSGDYNATSDIFPGISAEIDSQSGGAAAANVSEVELTSVALDQLDVRVRIDAAPGSGETTTVAVRANVIGVAAD